MNTYILKYKQNKRGERLQRDLRYPIFNSFTEAKKEIDYLRDINNWQTDNSNGNFGCNFSIQFGDVILSMHYEIKRITN